MAHIPVTRAPALPSGAVPTEDVAASPHRWLRRQGLERGETTAYVVHDGTGLRARSWSTVADTVERAAAGLVRSGLRADQVVLDLLPATSAYPELDLALRLIGSVVVHVSPEATADDVARGLGEAKVRLVVAESEADLDRLDGLQFTSSELFAVAGGAGWRRLLTLGAERLTMDPDAVSRLDAVVDHEGAAPRLLGPGGRLTRLARGDAWLPALTPDDVTIAVGHRSDPVVQAMREAHLVSGGTLCLTPDETSLGELAETLVPTVAALPGAASTALPATAARLALERGVRVVRGSDVPVAPADLPLPPPVLRGDPSTLPRRSPREPGRDFQFDVDRRPVAVAPEESAFELPSLPLFGGESFLDKLLMAQAREGRA
ncbi:AMP-binding protein [Nocardioides sp. SYSU D00065]|uniref:AMP-binding protein n=1 Tax=Nocardioides sp. SYSU D00065 TaxID=2817378 RepID=UPI001B32927A|nr:AMP-binding protein [Nocardioides sp. SYSU D00065]